MIRSRGDRAVRIVLYAAAAVLVILGVGPALWLVLGAISPATEDLGSVPTRLTLDNFLSVWQGEGILGALVNSTVVTFFRAGLNVLLAALAAYPLARMRFRFRETIFVLILATMMVPEQVIVVPMFRIVVGLGLYDTLTALVVPFSVTAFGVYLCRQAFAAIPRDVEEAALIDGASSLRIWWSVMLPLAAPTLATLGVFSVIGAWSDLLWPLVVLKSEENFTLPIKINELLGQYATNVRLAYAASVMALVPIVVFFIAAQRWLKPNMFAGAVKG
ncbi:MAG: carbohydrate ABC transporter permease [Phycisphaerales bacterium]